MLATILVKSDQSCVCLLHVYILFLFPTYQVSLCSNNFAYVYTVYKRFMTYTRCSLPLIPDDGNSVFRKLVKYTNNTCSVMYKVIFVVLFVTGAVERGLALHRDRLRHGFSVQVDRAKSSNRPVKRNAFKQSIPSTATRLE